MRSLLFALSALVVGLGALPAQEVRWQISAKSPEGHVFMVQSDRRLRWRRDLADGATGNVIAWVVKSSAATPDAFLATLTLERETVRADSAADVRFADRPGRRHELVGPTVTGADRTRHRMVHAVHLGDGSFLVVSGESTYVGNPPEIGAHATVTAAVNAVLASIVAETAPVAGSGGSDPAAKDDKNLRFNNDWVVPLSFLCPEGWFVSADEGQVPGSIFMLASPDRDVPPERMTRMLRVNAFGWVPGLLTAADPQARATDMLRAVLAQRPGVSRTEVSAGFLAGTVRATILETKAPPLIERAVESMVLVAAADSAVVFAEVLWPKSAGAKARDEARRILESFRIEGMAAWTTVGLGTFAKLDHPLSWGTAPARTEDRSVAMALQSAQGIELTIRSILLEDPTLLSDAALLAALRDYVVDELGLLVPDDFGDAMSFLPPRASVGRHVLIHDADGTTDVFGFVRDGALHVGVLFAPDGIEGLDFGQALGIVLSVRGADAPAAPATTGLPLLANGRPLESLVFDTFGFDVYDAGGTLTRGTSGRLVLEPDGSADYRWIGLVGATEFRGTYEIKGNRLTVTSERGAALIFDVDLEKGQMVRQGSKLIWYRLPGRL